MKLYKRAGTYYADLRAEGQGRVSTGCTTYDKARVVAGRLARGHGTGHTLNDALNRAWDEHYSSTKGAVNVLSQMNILRASLGKVKLADIDTPWFKVQTNQMRARLNEKTVNRYLALLSMCLKLSCQWGWLDVVPYIPRLKESKGRIRTLTPTEQGLLDHHLTAAPAYYGWMADLIAFLLDTGARLGEAMAIDDVDRLEALTTGRWTIWVNKGDKARTIPLTGRAKAALARFQWNGRTNRDAQRAWAFAREAMGLQDDSQFIIHALRHTCASTLVNNGENIYAIQKFLGHASVTTTEKYAHLNDTALDSLVESLEQS